MTRLAWQLRMREAFLAMWRGLLGTEGTLAVPTCTEREGMPKPTFDPDLSQSEAGAFSEFFRKQPGVLRSHNPTHSVAALGPAAPLITGGHRAAAGRPSPWGDGAFGHGSPWDVLVARECVVRRNGCRVGCKLLRCVSGRADR